MPNTIRVSTIGYHKPDSPEVKRIKEQTKDNDSIKQLLTEINSKLDDLLTLATPKPVGPVIEPQAAITEPVIETTTEETANGLTG